ncbi:MAG: zinc-dependent alcohol dehydrogenase family protein [Bacteroidetes bacterium]|nr:zinc-dependent alcohol dehydrogenase family protein [Bacteroidota bacterium]
MKAFILHGTTSLMQNAHPLKLVDMPIPVPQPHEILVRIEACGVCHTELDEIEGRAVPAFFPIVVGHQGVGRVVERGEHVQSFAIGDRVGIAWIYRTCGSCEYCTTGRENLCSQFQATGRDVHGGYAEYLVVPEQYAYKIPEAIDSAHAAPLLCAGAIGYRSLSLTNIRDGQCLGFSGFGASAHLVLQMVKALYPNTRIYVFARSTTERQFAYQLGAHWAGDFHEEPPEKLHAIIDTTPVWKPIVSTLRTLLPGGRMVINAIRKENDDINSLLELKYERDLWMEKEIITVANVTRMDVQTILQLAGQIPLLPTIEQYPFLEANRALLELKRGSVRGAKVLVME